MDLTSSVVSAGMDGDTVTLAGRLGIALLLGAALGLDRELRSKSAGLRSHMLVSMAAASFALTAMALVERSAAISDGVSADPIRALEAVVTGVAFLGAGAIIQAGGTAKGLTTGASLWVAGAMGLASGFGQIRLAVLTAVFGLFVLLVLGWVERRAIDGRKAND
ncbi:MAG: MgtC/SapB family protein [Acetobacterales bacterium]